MAIGMPFDQFWNGEADDVTFYTKAHELKRDEQNQILWYEGYYNFIAVSTALSNYYPIGTGGKVPTYNEYLNKPLPIRDKTPEELQEEAEERQRKTILQLNALAAKWKAKEGDEDAGQCIGQPDSATEGKLDFSEEEH